MKPTASNVIRWAGLSAVAAGVIFAGIQPIHPPDFLPSVTTAAWAIIMPLKLAMSVLFLAGFAGLYARQVEESGWLGLAGFLALSLSWALQTAFVFAETFLLPVLATTAPQFVESFLGIVNGVPGEMNIGVLSTVYTVVGLLYLLGGVLFGIATFRARVLPRWAAGLLAVSGPLAAVMTSLLSHPLDRLAALPMGLALIGLGAAVWADRREPAAQPAPAAASPQLREASAK
ncbi:MAG: hypothetical protein JNK29_02980 [Anaerolineales bacterium]|nr:hypothetical protein [Anaerolineales bacterium]